MWLSCSQGFKPSGTFARKVNKSRKTYNQSGFRHGPIRFEAEIEAQAMEALAQEETILAELENERFMDNSAPQ